MNQENMKQFILERFHEMTWKLGLRRVTVSMLAKECGISNKTIYVHFKDKNEIISLSVDHFLDGIRKQIAVVDQSYDDPFEKLIRLFELSLKMADGMPEVLLYDILHFYPEIQKKMNEMFAEITHSSMEYLKLGAQIGVFKDINPGLVVSYVTGAANAVFKSEFLLKNNLSAEEAISGFRDFLLCGLLKQGKPA